MSLTINQPLSIPTPARLLVRFGWGGTDPKNGTRRPLPAEASYTLGLRLAKGWSRDEENLKTVIEKLLPRIMRTRLEDPGFAVINLQPIPITGQRLRGAMVTLADAIQKAAANVYGVQFRYRQLTRQNVVNETPLHRDAAHPFSLVMAGYEPSTVPGNLQIADATQWASDHGVLETQVKEEDWLHSDSDLQDQYTLTLPPPQPNQSRIVIFNNSIAPLSLAPHGLLRVSHGSRLGDDNNQGNQRILNLLDLDASTYSAETLPKPARKAFIKNGTSFPC